MSSKPIFVTQPYLPSLDEFVPYLEQIWERRILTNGGPFHQQLEEQLCAYLGVPHISLFNNGTIALITALQALNVTGEVITTPYSFVATSHSLLWRNVDPVFVDIDPRTLNMDPAKIEAAITERTSAILPVHCYGTPCDVAAIEKIADKHKLKVIYDAAHAFAVEDDGGSILQHGDLSVLSFHATKVFNTFEGGAIISPSLEMKKHIDNLKNFGFTGETSVVESGINGKMSEINAAMGLLQLKHMERIYNRRQAIDRKYRHSLGSVRGIVCVDNVIQKRANYSYFPILVENEYPCGRDEIFEILKKNGIYARRYFYPLISSFAMYKNMPSANPVNLPIANEVANKVICLPIYPDLSDSDVERIIALLENPEQ